MWRYIQSTGALVRPNGSILVVGYSGRSDDGKNRPEKQHEKGVGPIPRGRWKIGKPRPGPTPYSIPLAPDKQTETFGRSAFLIHGDNKSHTASQGCIIVSPKSLREEIWFSLDRDLLVVKDPNALQASLLEGVPHVPFVGKALVQPTKVRMVGRRALGNRKFDARPDTIDFRDCLFIATLVDVPQAKPLKEYLSLYRRYTGKSVPILDQGQEGACTGFGLAAVCNYLLGSRARGVERVSARMLYEMAKRYDEWPGNDYDGSSARGAMKGWHQHGVASEKTWPYMSKRLEMTDNRAGDAATRPLGAYFRVNHKDLVAMHAAFAETGTLYATAAVHAGWDDVHKSTGRIPHRRVQEGGHAFAIVGYEETGFWIQNSWGPDWGKGGFALLSYEDWLENGFDVWAARLGVPMRLEGAKSLGVKQGGLKTASFSYRELRRHIVCIDNDGGFKMGGAFGTRPEDIKELFASTIPAVTSTWRKPRILIYAHGGLVSESNAVQRVQDYLEPLLAAEVYPLAFVWRTDLWTTVTNILEDGISSRKSNELVGGTKDFLLDRTDDTLERVARLIGGKQVWGEMKENAVLSTMSNAGAARAVALELSAFLKAPRGQHFEVHLAGHSAGSIFLAPFCRLLSGRGQIEVDELLEQTDRRWDPIDGLEHSIKTCTLWAPACTVDLFNATYRIAVESAAIKRMAIFNLNDAAEQDDNCGRIYNKSLLYLVSNAFEKDPRRLFKKLGYPILGLDRFVQRDLEQWLLSKKVDYILAPNSNPSGGASASRATQHGAFDDDAETVQSTLARIVGRAGSAADFSFGRSAQSTSEKRTNLLRRARSREF